MYGLSDETIEKIKTIFVKHPEVEEVIIYGSRAKGTYREGSDIDITLKGGKITDSIFSQIHGEIDDLNTPYLFDISIFENLQSLDLIEHINRVGQVFYSKEFL